VKVKAKFKLGDREIEADVINPGGWFARCKVIEVGGGFKSDYFVVEAGSESDALDELAEDERFGHRIAIDIETEGGDYGHEVEPGDFYGGREMTEKGWMNLKGEFTTDESVGKYLSHPNVSGQGVYYYCDHVALPQGWTDMVYVVEVEKTGVKGTVTLEPKDWDDVDSAIETLSNMVKGQLTFG